MPNEPAEPLEPGTPLPWYQFDEYMILSRVPVDAGMDGKVADLDYSEFPPEVARQNAAYIVEACNNYLALQSKLSALEEPCVWTWDREAWGWRTSCRAALSEVNQGPQSNRFCGHCGHPISEHREET